MSNYILVTAVVLLITNFATVLADSKTPCGDEDSYPGYKGDICLKYVHVDAPHQYASRFCNIYGYEPFKVESDEDKEYVRFLTSDILKQKRDYWIGYEGNSTGVDQCSYLSNVTKQIHFANCNETKAIICMKTAFTHYLYNLDFLHSDIKDMREQMNKCCYQSSQSMQILQEKLLNVIHSQETMSKQLEAIRTALDNANHGSKYASNSNAENGLSKERRSGKPVERCAEPPLITRHPDNDTIIVIEGAEITLKCIASGNPPPTVQWFTRSNHAPKMGEEYPLQFISRTDAGEYMCVADNKIGPPVKQVFHLNVYYGPVCISPFTTTSTKIGGTVVLRCRTDADPKPKFRWYKDQMFGQLDSNSTHIGGQTYESTLKVQITSDHDLGLYRCVAINSVGQCTHTIHLTGAVPTVHITVARDETTNDHKIFQLTVQVSSDTIVNECEIFITSPNDPAKTVPITLRQGEQRMAKNEFSEVIHSNRIDYIFKPNTNYSIQMRCKNKNGWSEYSNLEYVVTYYICGNDLNINDNHCHYLISHAEYGKSAYISTYRCSSIIHATNCTNIRTVVVEVDQSYRQRCASRNTHNSYENFQIHEPNSERNSAPKYICNSGSEGIVSQSNQLTLEVNKVHPDSMHGFKLCFKCENRNLVE